MAEERQSTLADLCIEKGMRMTEQRRVIASVIEAASDEHPDVEELYRRSVAIDPGISISTVYRTVKLFEDAGMIERHDFRDGRSRYETVPDEHHDHLIDLRSGQALVELALSREHEEVLQVTVQATSYKLPYRKS